MSIGIYCIENILDNKKYIGQSIVLEKRMYKSHNKSYVLNHAIKKYGRKNFKRYIILYCETDELDYYEKECIRIFHSRVDEWGYNILEGGNSSRRGVPLSKEHKEKIRIANLGENNYMYGKHPSPETRKLLSKESSGESNPNYGKHPSPETRKKQSDSHKGKKQSQKTIQKRIPKISGKNHYLYGKHQPEKTRAKISTTLSGENHFLFGTKRKGSSSLYFGVYIIVRIYKNRKHVYWKVDIGGKHIGTYKTETEAAKVYDKYVIANNLHRPLNFPNNK